MKRTVNCPRCEGSVIWQPESKFRPFCSERCKFGDLAAWASDEYRLASDSPPDPGELADGGTL